MTVSGVFFGGFSSFYFLFTRPEFRGEEKKREENRTDQKKINRRKTFYKVATIKMDRILLDTIKTNYCKYCKDLEEGLESQHKSPHSPSKCKHYSCDKCNERHRKGRCKTKRVCTRCGGNHRTADCKVLICTICRGDHKKVDCKVLICQICSGEKRGHFP